MVKSTKLHLQISLLTALFALTAFSSASLADDFFSFWKKNDSKKTEKKAAPAPEKKKAAVVRKVVAESANVADESQNQGEGGPAEGTEVELAPGRIERAPENPTARLQAFRNPNSVQTGAGTAVVRPPQNPNSFINPNPNVSVPRRPETTPNVTAPKNPNRRD